MSDALYVSSIHFAFEEIREYFVLAIVAVSSFLFQACTLSIVLTAFDVKFSEIEMD